MGAWPAVRVEFPKGSTAHTPGFEAAVLAGHYHRFSLEKGKAYHYVVDVPFPQGFGAYRHIGNRYPV
jgi:hypothetical protein